jgi:hypothetical protein
MTGRKPPRRPGDPSSGQVAGYAWAYVICPACGAEPRSACVPLPAPPRTVCRERFAAAALALRKERKAASPSREALEASARLDLATERGTFMADIAAADVTARIQQTQNPDSRRNL